MRVVYSTASLRDLEEIGEWISQENNVRAQTFIEELRNACDSLADMPRTFPLVHHTNIRRKPYKRYLIFYIVSDDGVEIARVIHGARDYMRILFPS